MLHIFQGGVKATQGQPREAIQLYLQALQGDPYVSGAWKDLGELYYETYDGERAWQCWDVARRLRPQHEMLKPVDELEAEILKHSPGYF